MFAQIVLLFWAPIAIGAYYFLGIREATMFVYLTGTMFLPEVVEFQVQGFPELDKHTLTMLSMLAGILLRRPQAIMNARPGRGLEALVLCTIVLGFGTVLTNGDRLVYQGRTLPGLSMRDGVSLAVEDILLFGIPLLVGRALFREVQHLEKALRILVMLGLVYSILILLESRLSPQLHKWIYGFHQNEFKTSYRLGGWRPMVFMESGLEVGTFMAGCAIATVSLGKAGAHVFGVGCRILGYYSYFILLICRSLGAILEGTAFVFGAWFMGQRSTARMVLVVGTIVLAFPILRITQVFPTDLIASVGGAIDEERANSYTYRVQNEDLLIEHGLERPVFGWGGYRRNRVFTRFERADTISDGYWIIELGQRGVPSMLARFLILLVPVFRVCRYLYRYSERQRWILLGMSMVILIRCIDLLPNGFYSSLPVLLAGALSGVVTRFAYGEASD